MNRFIVLLLLICTACNIDEQDETSDPVFCTTELSPGLEITVLDATNNMLIVTGITVIVTDNDYTETLVNFADTDVFVGAFERTGSYTITVSGDGYETFITDVPIVVEEDFCHVITESMDILLISQ